MGRNLIDYKPLHFVGEEIKVSYIRLPVLEKKPGPPDAFTWRGKVFHISEVLSEWHNYQRRGFMAKNMRPSHSASAARRGSWGVGQDYFRVKTSIGRIFDIYYDRAPKNVDDRKGAWFLDKELSASLPLE